MKNMMSCFKEGEEGVMELISRQVLDLWNKYKPTIAVDAIEYDRELRQLLSTNLAEVGTDLISRQATIDTEGLDEEIRCEMCKNPMHTDRGCDGHCKYDEKLYERIMQVLDERIKPLPSAQPEIVQCKECKYHRQKNCPIEKYFSLDGFCSRGER